MIKTGLYRREQLASRRNTRGLFGGRRRISITLYDQIQSLADANEWAEQILLLHSDGRGAYKRTYRHRFDEFDALALGLIGEGYGGRGALVIHDAGVSDARTACDFFRTVSVRFADLTYYATDYDPALLVLALGNIKVTMNRQQQMLEVVSPPFVFNVLKHENFLYYPVNYPLFLWARSVQAPRVLAAYRAGKIAPKTLSLYCPDAVRLAGADPRFRLLEHDLLAPFPHTVDVVRAMNVLNTAYFTPGQFAQVVGNVFASLSPGGLLIVGSNDDAGTEVRGAVYNKIDDGFAELARSGREHDAHRAIMEHRAGSG
jgi:hypothetical protein